jgi:DNA transformation protein and related proteins
MKPQSDSFSGFVFERLEQIPGFRSRRMFGGIGLYAGGKFFGLIDERRLYFRTDETSRGDYVTAGMSYFQPNPKQALRSYYEVPADILEDDHKLLAWAQRAIAVAPEK